MTDRCRIDPSCIVWEFDPDAVVCDPCLDLSVEADLETFTAAFRVAAQIVYRKTGYRWPGDCFVERVRPCIDGCACVECNPCRQCISTPSVPLYRAFCLPLLDIIQVRCDGEQLWTPGDGVRLEWRRNRPFLSREVVGGAVGGWPRQDMRRPDEDLVTWSIDARVGCAPPEEVISATAAFANEIVKECNASGCGFVKGASKVVVRNATITRDPKAPSVLWLQILNDLYDTYGDPDLCDLGRDLNPRVTFHHVFGPVALADCEPLGCPDPVTVVV